MSYNFSFKTFVEGEEISISYFPHFVSTGQKKSSTGGVIDASGIEFDNSTSNVVTDSDQSSVSASQANSFRSLRRTKQTVYDVARMNDWDYFITFTFSENCVDDRSDYSTLKSKVQNWLNNYKKRYSFNLKYLVVSEFHQDGAIHFHGLVANVNSADLLPSSDPDHVGEFYNVKWNYGRNYFSPIKDRWRVTYYITKYITKDYISIPGKQRYIRSQGLKLPEKVTEDIPEMDLIQYVYNKFPDYEIVHSYNGNNDSCFLQLKRRNSPD